MKNSFDLNLKSPKTMRQLIDEHRVSDRFIFVLLTGFAAIALLLAAVGIYGMMSFSVAQRNHEIGIRIALGADRASVVALFVRGGLKLTLLGVSIGLLGSVGLGRLLHVAMFHVGSIDYWSLGPVTATLVLVSVFSCWIPARRCAAVDPIRALHDD